MENTHEIDRVKMEKREFAAARERGANLASNRQCSQ